MRLIGKVKTLPIEDLDPWPWSAQHKGGGSVKLNSIPMGIMAFGGPPVETLLKHMHEWNETIGNGRLPNSITCLAQNYTLLQNDGWLFLGKTHTEGGGLYINDPATGGCLSTLFDHLMKIMQAWTYAQPRTPLSKYLD